MKNVVHSTDPFLKSLIQGGILSADQVHTLMDAWRATGRSLDYLCVDMGFVAEDILLDQRSKYSGVSRIDRETLCVDEALLEKLGHDLCEGAYVAPMSFEAGVLRIALGDVTNVGIKDTIRRILEPKHLEVFLAARSAILATIKKATTRNAVHLCKLLTHEGSGDQAPAFFLDGLFDAALDQDSSDIHFDLLGDTLRIQRRMDGVLAHWMYLYKAHWPALLAKLKIMAGLEPTEKRFPQHGRFTLQFDDRSVDCRLATHPTFDGERVGVLFLHQSKRTLDDLGFDPSAALLIGQALMKKQGLIVVTGPTGSGKTTTLHALLRTRAGLGDNIMTLEDPVEYRLEFAAQTQVSDQKGLDFEGGIASVLRQDVDVLLIGEIRTASVAQMALRSAMTGHQIFTSVHAPNALATLDRLRDLGVSFEDMLSYIHCVISQRLVRRLCASCKKQSRDRLAYEAVGCPECLGTGYRGRQILAECLVMDERTGSALRGTSAANCALSYSTFKQGAAHLIQTGITSQEEVIRVLGEDMCLAGLSKVA
jgi:type II secretory ATPase GspE/PulE/Tfp pilus assembly ATPase PilB-like protein